MVVLEVALVFSGLLALGGLFAKRVFFSASLPPFFYHDS
jgi:hypothetical protein